MMESSLKENFYETEDTEIDLEDLHEQLEQTRFELVRLKKDQNFKDNLMADYEKEVEQLSESNKFLQSKVTELEKCLAQTMQTLTILDDEGFGLDSWSSSCSDVGRSEWNSIIQTSEKPLVSLERSPTPICTECSQLKSEFDDQLQEKDEQIKTLRNVNRILQDDVERQDIIIAELNEDLILQRDHCNLLTRQMEALRRDKDNALNDLKDFVEMRESMPQLQQEFHQFEGSIGRELGLPSRKSNFIEEVDWNAVLPDIENVEFPKVQEIEDRTSEIPPGDRNHQLELQRPSMTEPGSVDKTNFQSMGSFEWNSGSLAGDTTKKPFWRIGNIFSKEKTASTTLFVAPEERPVFCGFWDFVICK